MLVKRCIFISIIINSWLLEISSQSYFQQEVNYSIHVTLNDKRHELNADEVITYINNSPDTLRFLYFHLWPNAYSSNKTDLAKQLFTTNGYEKLFDDPELRGFIDSMDFRSNGQKLHWQLMPGQPDICKIILSVPLGSGDTMILTTPFHVKLPKGITSRIGHLGESYQISQWYPKAAVYDINGWHQMPYLDQGEFYSDFGNYNIQITLPENYIVGATGNLQNKQEQVFLDNLAAKTAEEKDTVYADNAFPASSDYMKTIHYVQDNCHDFAWFADKRFHVLKGNVTLPLSGKVVTTWVMYTNQQANLWLKALPYVNRSIILLSKWNGDFPYQNFTVVQSALNAGVGMEYPGITVIGMVPNDYGLDEVISHEVGHNWFYGALGSNERRFPYLDEGITTANQLRYLLIHYPEKKLWDFYFKKKKAAVFFQIDNMPVRLKDELDWLIPARLNLEQPINLPAISYNSLEYSSIIYSKTATGFNYLRAYLGDSIYDAAMQDYFQQWKFRHPQPDDLQNIVESHTTKNLSWFFVDFLSTTKRLDYKAGCLKNHQLLIRNAGELYGPVLVAGRTKDSIYFAKWIDGFKGQRWIDLPPGNYKEVIIDPNHIMPELYRLNNNIRTSGLFKKTDPIKVQLLFTLDDPEKRALMYFPAFDWTRENGFMMGIVIHNGFLLPKRFAYVIMPFISIKNASIAGFTKITINVLPYARFFRLGSFSLESLKFGAPDQQNYLKMKGSADFYLRSVSGKRNIYRTISGSYSLASDLEQIVRAKKAAMLSFFQVCYHWGRAGILHPFNIFTSLEGNKRYQKSIAELNYKVNYYGQNNALDIRLFAGTMLTRMAGHSIYALSAGARNGRALYLYQGTFPDRFTKSPSTFWSRQMMITEGGLVTPVNDSLGYSRWLISATFTSNLPLKKGKLPVKTFACVILNDHGLRSNHPAIFYEAGLKVGIWNFFEIYIPLLLSENLRSSCPIVKDRIRITLTFDSFSKVKLDTKLVN